jgi:zinc transporter, ZIP family
VIEAFFWGAFASSSLLVGGLLALNLPLSKRVIGLVMAFGAGVLISALAYELFLEATHTAPASLPEACSPAPRPSSSATR